MAASNATAFPVADSAYRVYFCIKSLATGNPVTGGLTSLAGQYSQDGATFVNSTNSPVEILGSGSSGSGYGYLDLLASEMNFTCVIVRITAGNANALEFQCSLLTSGIPQLGAGVFNGPDYGDNAGRATTVGGQIAQIWRYLFNAQTVDKNAQTQTLLRDNSVSALVQGTIAANSSLTQKGKMS